jgi:hypothetical protein
MIESYAWYIELGGLVLIVAGWLWMLTRSFQRRVWWGMGNLILPPLAVIFGLLHWRKGRAPLALILIGFVIAAFPPVYSLLVPIDLGPRETMVDRERHITLTGWDREDYAFLGTKRDVVVLQMANPDVTDWTLIYLKGMNALKELDLNNTQVTDAGLKILKDLPALKALRLKNTKITDQGFQDTLGAKDSLMELDLRGTGVKPETVQTWKKSKQGRRDMQ